MTLQHFQQLNLDERAEIVLQQGKLISTRAIYNKSSINLYNLGSFYVEVFHDVHTAVVQKIEPITEDEILYWYIDIRDLL